MKKLLFILVLFISCQKESISPTSLKSGDLTVKFTDGTEHQLGISYYTKLVLDKGILKLVPDTNCSFSTVYCANISFINVVSFSIANEKNLVCK